MSRLENNRYAVGFQLTSRMSRQVLPPSTKPLHLPHLPFPSVATVTYRRVARSEAIYKKLILQDALQGATFSDAQVRGCPYMSTVSGQCPLSDVAALCFSPPSQRECVREHTRARARNGVPWSHLDGMSRAVRLKEERARFILRLCTSTRVLFLGRVPSRSSSVSPHFREQLVAHVFTCQKSA